MDYAIWNAQNGGWMTRTGTYTSEWKDAKRVSITDAIALCRRAYITHADEFRLIPVAVNAIEAVMDQ